MKLGPDESGLAKAIFAMLASQPHFVPSSAYLSDALAKIAPKEPGEIGVERNLAKHFATASVDAWVRGVHSFLVSNALTDSSPIWSSVAGYYASHYTVRSLAHLLGYFSLYGKRYFVRLRVNGTQYSCIFDRKTAGDREHKRYWKVINETTPFKGDPLYPQNKEDPPSDVGHRDWANYKDHLMQFYPEFRFESLLQAKERISRISKLAISTTPIPDRRRFPDIDTVQIASYHRLVRYRDLLDNLLPSTNRYWEENRNPTFAKGFLNYQLVETPTLGNLAEIGN